MHAIDLAKRAFSTRAVTEYDREGSVDRADQTWEGRPPEIGMLIHTRGNERMRHLHEQRGGPAE
jgi:hypothetical protein